MDIITDYDAIHLANALSVKSGLNVHISTLAQCTSDFVLALYLSIMGELPSGVLTDCSSGNVKAQEHNISCIVETLANEYLLVDLSHISPTCFIEGDPVTVFNLFEIMNGLLDFMLEQIDVDADSGDEADIDSDILSAKSLPSYIPKKDQDLDVSTCTTDLINLELSSHDLPTHDTSDTKRSETFHKQRSASPSLSSQLSWEELKPSDVISEHTLEPSTLTDTLSSLCNGHSETYTKLEAETSPRPMLIDSLRNADEANGSEILEDMTNSLRSTYKVQKKPEPEVHLDTSIKGSGISVSDFTSESSKSEFEPQPAPKKVEIESSSSSSGVDVADGIPKPDIQSSSETSDTPLQEDALDRRTEDSDKDWEGLLHNLQQTVEESKRIREKYFATPHPADNLRSLSAGDGDAKESFLSSDADVTSSPPRQKNVRFEDTISTATAKKLEDFKKILKKENDLQNMKNKILSDNYRDHLEEVQEAERRKMMPLVKHAEQTGKDYQRSLRKERKKTPKKSNSKKDLASAAKWRSWQTPIVVRTPKPKVRRTYKKLDKGLVIGEHDLLPTLMSEFPGLELSSTILNNAWKKQFRQIEMLTKKECNHSLQKRLSEKKLEEAHDRHQLLIDMMRKEHEHNQRVRDARERSAGEQEAARTIKDRRQQTARVRRYYRDYQLQMRARMLKRRTREEKLFKNLFEEGLKIQRSRLNDLRRYARDKRSEQQLRQRNEIASLENYYKDQFAILAETLETEKKDLKTRNDAQSKLLRQMTAGLRQKMEKEIMTLQEQIARDDDDIYFRELEADRIRRQLQMATYNAKFNSSIPNLT